ncbi:MAG: hypothetical protein GX096_06780 [Clostridiales bacterium]|nr:hypothetical protein [Clostridiales bacterium]
MKKMTNADWQRAYEPLPDMLESRVQYTLSHLEGEKHVRKFSMRTAVLVLALLLALGGVAYAIIHSQTAEFFGEFYGEERKEEMLAGDLAQIGQSYQLGDVNYTIEDAIYKSVGTQKGMYGVIRIKPVEGSGAILLPSDYSVNDPAGYVLHMGNDEAIPDDAPSYAELAGQTGGKILHCRASVQRIVVGGEEHQSDFGEVWVAQPDGSMLGSFEILGDYERSDSYEITFGLSNWEVTTEGEWLREEPNNTWLKEAWTLTVTPERTGE